MRKLIFIIISASLSQVCFSQVSEMNWELDYQIYLTMANDSNYSYDVRELFHVTDLKNPNFTSEFVFYPVNPGENYSQEMQDHDSVKIVNNTLWSALNSKLGGGWVHFANCIAYALETQQLNLQEAIMKRPETSWKPDPVTDTWKRTHKWKYYVPVDQKLAISEYRARLKNNELGDLKNLPLNYIDDFLSTSNKEYLQLIDESKFNELAQLNLVKVILGSNYLGEAQISYMSNAILLSVQNYSASNLPSVLIFDDFDAAAAMSINTNGYLLESIVFRASAELSEEEITERQSEISEIIKTINEYNRESFKKRLRSYYSN